MVIVSLYYQLSFWVVPLTCLEPKTVAEQSPSAIGLSLEGWFMAFDDEVFWDAVTIINLQMS